jgi:predicted NACHT family NTPase
MDRSICASITGIEAAKKALKLKGWTQEYLAGASGCSRQTVINFFAGKTIEKRIFQAICTELGLKQEEITEQELINVNNQLLNIDEFVEALRKDIYDSIQEQCGFMRVLEMSQPIKLGVIYTTVNILEKITGRQRKELQDVVKDIATNISCENFDRIGLNNIHEERVPALDAVKRYPKLMILGKPGSGKTTFLKYVALQCISGEFNRDLVPIFINLKGFAETPGRPTLLEYLINFFKDCGNTLEYSVKTGLFNTLFSNAASPVEYLLKQGKLMLLLDGLDEVMPVDNYRISRQIQDFSRRFAKNTFVVTCRIAAKEIDLEAFVEVETADFDKEQIANFVTQWFNAKNDPVKAKLFIEKSEKDRGIKELATNPLLLTLLCLVFESSGCFPINRSELYEEGLDVLLRKWDVKRNIERDEVYQKLSTKRKEDLLSRIAFDTFQKSDYFFRKKDLEHDIASYIRNLPDVQEKDLQSDSKVVLQSIEVQHGLLVERAREIYSFSHLTFHEYFAARRVVMSTDAEKTLSILASKVVDKRWHEIFLFSVGMLENAETFLLSMKHNIDRVVLADEKLQAFLSWVEQKSAPVKSSHSQNAIRAFYLGLDLTLSLDLCIKLGIGHSQGIGVDVGRTLELNLGHDFDLNGELALDLVLHHALSTAVAITVDRALVFSYAPRLERDMSFAFDLALSGKSHELQQSMQEMKNKLPSTSSENRKNFYAWWKSNGQQWTEQLNGVMTKYLNIGKNWQFTANQNKLIRQYYYANKLLVDCLNSECYICREVRAEIEDTLLLPIASIQARQNRS